MSGRASTYRDFFKPSIGKNKITVLSIKLSFQLMAQQVIKSNFSELILEMSRRPDITEGLKTLQCRTLIFVGDSSPFHSEALHMTAKLDRRYSALVEVYALSYILTFCNFYAIFNQLGNRVITAFKLPDQF